MSTTGIDSDSDGSDSASASEHEDSPRWADELAEKMVGDHFSGKNGPAKKSSSPQFFEAGAREASRSPELSKRLHELELLAVQTFRSQEEAARWFDTPKPVALKHLTPRQYITTTGGCDVVERLLKELNS